MHGIIIQSDHPMNWHADTYHKCQPIKCIVSNIQSDHPIQCHTNLNVDQSNTLYQISNQILHYNENFTPTLNGDFGICTPPHEMVTVCLTGFFGMYLQEYVPSLLSLIWTSTGLRSTSKHVMWSAAFPAFLASTVNSAHLFRTTPVFSRPGPLAIT